MTASLFTAPAFAARTEVAVPGLPGQGRVFYDTTSRALGFEMENTDTLWMTRFGADGTRLGYYMNEGFDEGASQGLAILTPAGAAFSGTTGALNTIYLPRGNKLTCGSLGAGQTLAPLAVASGLDISGDETADEGYECWSHMVGATGSPLVIGTTPAFYFKVGVTVADVSGSDDLQCGFRKVEPINAAINDYTDYATLGWNTAADPAAIKIETENDAAAGASTDTTQTIADGVNLTMKFLVSAAGVVTYQHDAAAPGTLAAPTVTAAYTFDDGDLVIPFCRTLQDTALTGEVDLTEWTVALQN